MLLNAFSLNMLTDLNATIRVSEITARDARTALLAEAEAEGDSDALVLSAVGHADTAAVFSDVLGLPVPAERRTVSLSKGDSVIVGQYRGLRLPEGATELPKGAEIRWVLVEVI